MASGYSVIPSMFSFSAFTVSLNVNDKRNSFMSSVKPSKVGRVMSVSNEPFLASSTSTSSISFSNISSIASDVYDRCVVR